MFNTFLFPAAIVGGTFQNGGLDRIGLFGSGRIALRHFGLDRIDEVPREEIVGECRTTVISCTAWVLRVAVEAVAGL